MKKLLVVALLGLSSLSFGQSLGKWSVGVGYTPSIQGGTTFAAYGSYHFSDKWQVGIMPFGWFDSYENPGFNSQTSNSLGLNLTSRYAPVQFGIFKPYLYSFVGYGHSTFKYNFQNNPTEISTADYINLSIGIGGEVGIGRGWSVDTNYGYLRLEFFDNQGYTNSMYFSVGILKRLGK